jgi:hypothetical protein
MTVRIGQRRPVGRRATLKHNLRGFGALVLVFVAGLLVGRGGGLDLGAVPGQLARSVLVAEDLPVLVLDMDFDAYDDILGQRQRALRDGVFIPSNRDFVTATLRLADAVIPVRLRLPAGPAERLGEGQKWGFEVRVRGEQRLFDMARFYLLDPAANNLLNQWAFSRALEREGLLSARYHFVRLVLNGDDWGAYALQEEAANELLAAQGRPPGVWVKFDAALLWKSVAHFQGDAQAAYADPVAKLSASDLPYLEVDALRDAAIAGDPLLSSYQEQAIGLLRGLQSGALPPSMVFDLEKYGRFLALVDLWGATQATSLVNLRYYYDPTTSRLEPLGLNANALGSEARLSLAATYDDPALQAAYVEQAARLSQPEYLEQLKTALEPEWRRLQGALEVEYPGLTPPWEQLRARQAHMRRSLDPVQPVLAYLGSPTLALSGTLRIEVGNVLNLPVEVLGFDIGGATFMPVDAEWLPEGATELLTGPAGRVILRALDAQRAPLVRYARFDVPLVELQRQDNELDFMQEPEVRVATRILGLSTTHYTPARRGVPDIFVVGGGE